MFLDSTFLLLVPAMVFALYAQSKINSAFSKYLKVKNSYGFTGFEVARKLLDSHGLQNIPIEHINKTLGDHYDPRNRVLRLSNEVYNSDSVASVGVAAHECGHAIQHQEQYTPLTLRNSIAPIASIGSRAAFLFIIAGIFMNALNIFDIGILLFSAAVVFQIITLPVEFNASNRAMVMLVSNNLIPHSEAESARKVLNAAALTYVAATITAVLQLVRLLVLRGRRN